ncbi:MAG: GDSL-type esterase/lipase family protein [Candidatus Binatia bacterium]|nr:GDSL-type esterase/lipase family protein [Candidatus Binatia bacterium]
MRISAGTFLTILLCALGCSSSHDGDAGNPDGPGLSVVAIGDSVSAGEGVRYGFEYVDDLQIWVGPTDLNPDWDGDYPSCHQAGAAYPNKATAAIDGKLSKFSCTGATYPNGVVSAQVRGDFTLRPAQFGNWSTQEDLNAAYDEAEPEIVLITLGANDLQWSNILAACILGSVLGDQVDRAVDAGSNLRDALAGVLDQNRDRLTAWVDAASRGRPLPSDVSSSDRICTAENPGKAIEQFFIDQLPTLRAHYAELVSDIQARGERTGRVPRIVFTTYHDPFPGPGGRFGCPDLLDLNENQVAYLRTLLDRLSEILFGVASEHDGVEVVDIRDSMVGHEFCTSDPWAYGLSIEIISPGNPAPFHPTPDGHQAISDLVVPSLRGSRP